MNAQVPGGADLTYRLHPPILRAAFGLLKRSAEAQEPHSQRCTTIEMMNKRRIR